MIQALIKRLREERERHPELEPELNEIYCLCVDEIDAGESEYLEVEKALDDLDELIRRRYK